MNYFNKYVSFLKKRIRLAVPLAIVCDSSDGTTGLVLKKIFAHERKMKATLLNATPNGNFPAHGPNPLSRGAMEALGRAVVKKGADLGAIFDADGDRVFFMDNLGREADLDKVTRLYLQNRKGKYLTDVRSGYLLRGKGQFVSEAGGPAIKRNMRKYGIGFGFERSGHFYFRELFNCDSGVFMLIEVMNMVSALKRRGMTVADALESLPYHARIPETNFEVKNQALVFKAFERWARKRRLKLRYIDGITAEGKNFWCNIRASNTEPVMRLNMEAKDDMILRQEVAELKTVIQ